MSLFSVQQMHCTVCGNTYAWTCKSSYPHSRTYCGECNEEWKWRETLSIMGKAYYPRPSKTLEAAGKETEAR